MDCLLAGGIPVHSNPNPTCRRHTRQPPNRPIIIPMQQVIIEISGRAVTLGEIMTAGLAMVVVLLVIVMIQVGRSSSRRGMSELAAAERRHELEARIADLVKNQGEIHGRMQTMAEVFSTRQGELNRSVSERLDGLGHRLNQNVSDSTRQTTENLQKLGERLAVIDRAQSTITDLTGQVVELQHILSNKQTRGAFGQGRMEAIIQDGLPTGAYEFEPTLSNNNKPDCLVRFPNDAPSLVIDAKFPLEAFNLIRGSETPEDAKIAAARFRKDVQKHIGDIRERYLLPGETQDTAFMFVPSESVFAELNENFEDMVQRALRSRIVIVSPSLLMLSIQVIQAIMRDARMREQAHIIQDEVRKLLQDTDRIRDRVMNLRRHFDQASKDIELIETSAGKVTKRGQAIESLEVGNVGDDEGDEGGEAVVTLVP